MEAQPNKVETNRGFSRIFADLFSVFRIRVNPRRSAVAFLAACLLGPLPAQVIQEGHTVRHHKVEGPSVSPEVTAAEDALDHKDYAKAEPLLKSAVSRDANDYRAWFDLGFLYNSTNREADSIDAYRKSVAAKPDIFESNLNLGLMLARAQQPEAEKYLSAAVKLKPSANANEGLERAWLSLGQVLEPSKPQEAVAAYQQAAKLQPKDPEPHLAAGLLLEKQSKWDEAAEEYRQVAALDPQSSEALAGLVNVYSKQKRLPEAETALRTYVGLNPQNATAHVQLGRVLAAENKTDDALAEFDVAMKIAPGDADALREIAALNADAKKYDQAATLYRTLLQKNPNDAQLHYQLGLALLHQQSYPESQTEFLAAIKLKPDFGQAYGDLAIAASENKDYMLALKALDARAKVLPENPATLFLRATSYDHLRAFKQAAESYRQFLVAANGKFPDEEWKARHRLIAIEPKK